MPRIPEMDSPTVGMTPFQSPGASAAGADVFNMPDIVGKQASLQGAAMMSTAAIFKKIADNIEYDLADAQAKEMDVKVAQADQSTIEGYLQLSGKAAVDARAETYKSLEKNRETILQNLKDEGKPASPLVEQMFKNAANRRLEIATHQMTSHFVQQAKIWDNAASTARISQSINDANRELISNPAAFKEKPVAGQPTNTYWTLRNTAIAEVNLTADKNGVPKEGKGSEVRKMMLLETTTKLHIDAVNNLVKQAEKAPGAIKLAAEYLDNAVKAGEISSDKIDDLAQLVKVGGQKQQSMDLYLELKNMPLNKAIQTLEQRNKNGTVEVEVADMARQRLEHQYTLVKQQEADWNKSQMGAAQDWIINNPGKTIQQMPTNLYKWAKNEGHLAALDGFAQREGKAGNKIDELKTRGILLDLAMNDPDQFIAQFRKTGFADRMDLGAAGIKEMQNTAVAIIQNNGKFKTQFDAKILQDAIPQDLLKTSNKDKKDAFIALQHEAMNKWIKENPGKTPDDEAYRQVNKAANAEWISIGSVWNTKIRAYEARTKTGKADVMPSQLYESMTGVGGKDSEILNFYNEMRTRKASDEEILQAWKLKTSKVRK